MKKRLNEPLKQKKLSRFAMVALILFAYTWRIQNLGGQSLWRDETDAIYFALRDLPSTLSMFVDEAQNGALFFLSLRPWLHLVGSSEFALRYPSVIFGVLAIPILWQVCRRLIPSRRSLSADAVASNRQQDRVSSIFPAWWDATLGSAPMIAAVFLAINPYHLWYSQDGKMYALITLLALVAVWFWLSGIDRGGWRPWLGFLVTVSIAIYTHLLMILLIPLFVIWFMIAWPQSKYHKSGFLLALAGLTLPYLPLLWWQWGFLTANRQLTEFSFTPLNLLLKTELLYQSGSVLPPRHLIYLLPLLLITLIAIYGGYRVINSRSCNILTRLSSWRRILLILSWLIIPIATIYLVSLRQPVFLPRYIIWITPAVSILMGLGVHLVWRSNGKRFSFLALALFTYVFAYWAYIGWQEKTDHVKDDLRSAVRYVYNNRQIDELLILQIPHTHISYRYYSSDQGSDPFDSGDQRLGRWSPGLTTNSGSADDDAWFRIDEQMHLITYDEPDIWVVYSEEQLVDPNSLMEEWLAHNTSLVDKVEFRGIRVHHYQSKQTIGERQEQILSLAYFRP